MNTVVKEDAQRRELSFCLWNQSVRVTCRRVVENVPNSCILREKKNKKIQKLRMRGKFRYLALFIIW